MSQSQGVNHPLHFRRSPWIRLGYSPLGQDMLYPAHWFFYLKLFKEKKLSSTRCRKINSMEKTYAGHTMMRNAERINKNTVSGFFFGVGGIFLWYILKMLIIILHGEVTLHMLLLLLIFVFNNSHVPQTKFNSLYMLGTNRILWFSCQAPGFKNTIH